MNEWNRFSIDRLDRFAVYTFWLLQSYKKAVIISSYLKRLRFAFYFHELKPTHSDQIRLGFSYKPV
jgi:hypothetical protein